MTEQLKVKEQHQKMHHPLKCTKQLRRKQTRRLNHSILLRQASLSKIATTLPNSQILRRPISIVLGQQAQPLTTQGQQRLKKNSKGTKVTFQIARYTQYQQCVSKISIVSKLRSINPLNVSTVFTSKKNIQGTIMLARSRFVPLPQHNYRIATLLLRPHRYFLCI